MSVLAIRTIIYKRAWTLLEASAAVCDDSDKDKVRPRNRIRLDGRASDPEKKQKSVGDFPEISLSYGPYIYKSFSESRRYGQHLSGGNVGRTKELTQTLILKLTHADMQTAKNDLLDIAVIEAIEAGGSGMGLCPSPIPYIERGDLTADTNYGFTEQSGGTTRQQTTIAFPVIARWKGEPVPTQTV